MIAALKRLKQGHKTEPMPDEMAAFAINAGAVQKADQADNRKT